MISIIIVIVCVSNNCSKLKWHKMSESNIKIELIFVHLGSKVKQYNYHGLNAITF